MLEEDDRRFWCGLSISSGRGLGRYRAGIAMLRLNGWSPVLRLLHCVGDLLVNAFDP